MIYSTHFAVENLQGSPIIQAQMYCTAMRQEKREREREKSCFKGEECDVYSNNLNRSDLLRALFDAGLPQTTKKRLEETEQRGAAE